MSLNLKTRRSSVITALALVLVGSVLPTLSRAASLEVLVRGSVNAIYVNSSIDGAPSVGTAVTARNSRGVTVGTGVLDSYGALVLYDIPAAKGYTVSVGALTTPPFEVLSAFNPPAASLYSGAPLQPGINYITMRDGIQLAVAVRLPDGKTMADGPFPTVVEFSGYTTAAPHSLIDAYLGRSGHSLSDPLLPSSSTAAGSLFAPAMGFAAVSIQMRGSGCSGGAYDLFGPTLATDGYDAIERIGRQSWVLNHKVGMVGISYSGISQFAVAGLRPPHLAAIAPMSPTDDLFSTGAPGGIRNTGFAAGWIAERVHDARPSPNGQSWVPAQITAGDTVCAANQLFHNQAQDVNAILESHTDRTASLYDVRSPLVWASRISVPVFLVGGLHDEQTGPQWPSLIGALAKNKKVWVTLQNGTHVDSFSPQVLTRWWEFLNLFVAQRKPSALPLLAQIFMSGAQPVAGASFPAVRFTTSANYSAALTAFQKDARIRVLFDNGNSSAGSGVVSAAYEAGFSAFPSPTAKALTYYLGAGGSLASVAPTSGTVTYAPDATTRPETSAGTSFNAWAAHPNYNWTPVASGSGVGFISGALTKNVTIVGPASMNLSLKSTATNTDVQVTVSEVRPTGEEMFITSGTLRASYRTLAKTSTAYAPVPIYTAAAAKNLTPNVATTLRVPLTPIAYTFRTGSKIRVTITAPGGERPTWKYGTLVTGGAVTNTLMLGKGSALVLPSVSGVTPTDSQPACGSNRGQPCRTYAAANNGG